jgi:tetratricopeptide (TPR) repeat protein
MADNAPSKDLYGVADALCRAGQYRKAQPIIERFLARNPESGKGWCLASWAATSIGDPTAGLEYAARAIALSPQEEWPVRNYALALRSLGRFGVSLEFAYKAVALDPDEVLSWRCVAESARYFGRPDEAEIAANRAMAIAPDSLHSMYALVAAAGIMKGNEGIEIMLRALEREPNSLYLLRELAIIYSRNGRLDEATDLLERVLKQQPRDRYAHSRYLAIRGQLRSASDLKQINREHFEHELRSSTNEIERRSTDFRPYVRSAVNARRLGHHHEALAFARAASLHPPGEQFVEVWRGIAYTACAAKQWELAKFAIHEAHDLDPSAPYRWLEIAEVAYLAGNPERAVLWARRVIDEQPLCIYVLNAQAIVACCLGDFEKASSYLRKDLEHFPFNPCGTSKLASCRAEVGDFGGALDAWRRAVDLDPNCDCEWRQLAAATMKRVGVEREH